VLDLGIASAAIDYETSFGSVDAQRTKRVVDWLEIEHCTRSVRSHTADRIQGSYRFAAVPTTCGAPHHHAHGFPRGLSGDCPLERIPLARSRFQLRLMLEKGERRRAPLPASDHPLRPRGYI
jgi:hypothetical protein